MSHNKTVISQMPKLVVRHEFERLRKQEDKPHRKGALACWSQFVAMFTCQMTGSVSLRDIESTLGSQKQHQYHLDIMYWQTQLKRRGVC